MISIAIDGPSGAGKSTIARATAKKLGFIYVDTGALYRAVGLKFLNLGFSTDLDCNIKDVLDETKVDIRFIDGEQRVYLCGVDVSEEIRKPQVSMMASAVSAKPMVREFLLEMQRKLARENNVIMDGRDIGTVVIPDATVKIFLTASIQDRAMRRFKELKEKGMDVSYDEILSDMKERDHNDSNRAIAPLKPAPDAILTDTTGRELNESLDIIMSIINERLEAV